MAIASKNSRKDKARRSARDRFADIAVPRLPLSAIFGFAIVGFGGALFLAYSRFSSADAITSARSPDEVPVYSARAVPLDPAPERIAAESVARLHPTVAAQAESERTQAAEQTQTIEPKSSDSLFASSASGELKGFRNFTNFSASNLYLAVTGGNFATGISAQTNASGDMAPDAAMDTMSMLPEPSAWFCGVGLIALVGARFLRARLRRTRSRFYRF
ncbi:MAG TPA: hypothetical protein VN921_02690 [Chthoniobacterales bacterium]|nr:hypothetical protein [Chthoniobacterales bacterium]